MGPRFAMFLKDVSGATAIEYALLAAGIAMAITTSVSTLGCSLTRVFNSIDTNLKSM